MRRRRDRYRWAGAGGGRRTGDPMPARQHLMDTSGMDTGPPASRQNQATYSGHATAAACPNGSQPDRPHLWGGGAFPVGVLVWPDRKQQESRSQHGASTTGDPGTPGDVALPIGGLPRPPRVVPVRPRSAGKRQEKALRSGVAVSPVANLLLEGGRASRRTRRAASHPPRGPQGCRRCWRHPAS